MSVIGLDLGHPTTVAAEHWLANLPPVPGLVVCTHLVHGARPRVVITLDAPQPIDLAGLPPEPGLHPGDDGTALTAAADHEAKRAGRAVLFPGVKSLIGTVTVAELLAPIEPEFAHYRAADMVPSWGIWTQTTPVNWKSVRDVDNEGYHVAMAHPALQDLYGATYYDEPFLNGVSRSFATYNPHAGRRWSVRQYVKIAPRPPELPEDLREAWVYYGIFPNAVIAATPETVQFYQEFPLTTGKTLLRGAIYRCRDETREQAAARYLAYRIDRDTMAEDVQLSVWSNESMLSEAFGGFYLSDLEYGVRTHHDHLRRQVPVLDLETAPDEKDMAALNDALLSRG